MLYVTDTIKLKVVSTDNTLLQSEINTIPQTLTVIILYIKVWLLFR